MSEQPNVPGSGAARGALVERIAEAIEDGLFRMHGLTSSCDHHEEARAVLPLVDAEVAAARAEERTEVEHWKHHAWEAGEGFKRAIEDAVRAGRRRRAAEAEVERLREGVRVLEAKVAKAGRIAKQHALTNHALGRGDHERNWLDLLAVLDSTLLASSPAATTGEARRETFAEVSRAMNRIADIWERDGSDPCRVRITREYANAYRAYAEGLGEPTGSKPKEIPTHD